MKFKSISKLGKLLVILMAVIMMFGLMPNNAFADTETDLGNDTPSVANIEVEAKSTVNGFVTGLTLSTPNKVNIPGFTFDPNTTEYSVTIADGSAIMLTKWAFTFSTTENLYCRFRIDGEKLSGQYANDRAVSENTKTWSGTNLKLTSLQHGKPHVLSVIFGQKYDSNGDGYITAKDEFKSYDQYDFTINLLPAFDEFNISDENKNSLALSPTYNIHSTAYVDDFYVSTTGSTITIDSLNFQSSKGIKLYVGDSEYTSTLSDVSVELDKFTPENSDIAQVPFLLKYDDGTTSYQRTITLHVDRSSHLPVITNTLSDIECDKNTTNILSVAVENSEELNLSYQWRCGNSKENLKEIPEATNSSFTVPTDSAGTLYYDCVVTNTVDGTAYSVNSNAVKVQVKLTYVNSPVILKHPGTYSLSESSNIYKTEYNQGELFDEMYIQLKKPEDGTKYSFDFFYNSSEATEGAVKINGTTKVKKTDDNGIDYVFVPIDALPIGENYIYCVVTASDSEDSTMSSATSSEFVKLVYNKIDFAMEGTGESENPYIIKNANDLTKMQEFVNSGNGLHGVYFKISGDIAEITLPTDWSMLGTSETPFAGSIDGNNKLLIVSNGGLPLLGYINGATVKNLNIYGEQIAGAGLVNCFTGVGLKGTAITIENVTLKSGSATLKSGLVASVGGNGFAHASADFIVVIRNCTVEECVNIGYNKDQNMIGSFAGRINGYIENCVSYANVYGVNYVGGILGSRDNAMGNCVVTNCTFGGTVTATGEHAGGITGGGYENATAPNGAIPCINGCTVNAIIIGADKVGGILGGDSYVAQSWDNVAVSISGNHFTGTVKATDGMYEGGVIGYLLSMNKYTEISDNTYAADCGTKNGIGFVKYIDTSFVSPATMDGTIVFNTENGILGLPEVKGCGWQSNHNRTDDPLGADSDKLAKGVKSDKMLAAEVDELIDEIGTPITLGSKKAVRKARKAYDDLTPAQKNLVENYAALERAERELSPLVIKQAEDLINALPEKDEITLNDKEAIEEARAAYDELTEDEKKEISKEVLKKLTDAEKAYEKLVPKTGDSNDVLVYSAVLMLSVVALMGTVVYKKRKSM